MAKKQKYYRTVIEVEVLSEEPVDFDTLADVAHEIVEGDCSGQWHTKVDNQEVDGPEMAKLLIAQGSDPGFFNLDDPEDTDEAS